MPLLAPLHRLQWRSSNELLGLGTGCINPVWIQGGTSGTRAGLARSGLALAYTASAQRRRAKCICDTSPRAVLSKKKKRPPRAANCELVLFVCVFVCGCMCDVSCVCSVSECECVCVCVGSRQQDPTATPGNFGGGSTGPGQIFLEITDNGGAAKRAGRGG
jgi:hypothetical protein